MTRTLPSIGECEITFEVYVEEERMICAIYLVQGTIKAAPKAWLQLIRSELKLLEGVARDAGCVEMRMAGRFKRSMFPDYEEFTPLSGLYGLRKVLIDGR